MLTNNHLYPCHLSPTSATDEPSKFARFVNKTQQSLPELRMRRSLDSSKSIPHAPLSCWNIFREDRKKPQATNNDPNEGRIYARYTTTRPSFWVALHQQRYDATRWSIMTQGKYYETVLTETFRNIILAEPQEQRQQQQTTTTTVHHNPLHVIDVGGNIGWYTLLSIAAALEQNHSIIVDIFEPNPRNHLRFCESLHLNDWIRHDIVKVNLFALGVTSRSMADKGETGRMDISTSGEGSLDSIKQGNLNRTVQFPLVTLDDMANELSWLEDSHNIFILKVDVEGFELDVLEGSQQILKSRKIQNIFLEGNLIKEDGGKFRHLVEVLVSCGYVAYKIGGFRGPKDLVELNWTAPSNVGQTGKKDSLVPYTASLMDKCQGTPTRAKKRRICNMWWRPAVIQKQT